MDALLSSPLAARATVESRGLGGVLKAPPAGRGTREGFRASAGVTAMHTTEGIVRDCPTATRDWAAAGFIASSKDIWKQSGPSTVNSQPRLH